MISRKRARKLMRKSKGRHSGNVRRGRCPMCGAKLYMTALSHHEFTRGADVLSVRLMCKRGCQFDGLAEIKESR